VNSITVVIDTNVMVSALLWEGKPHKLIKLAEEEKITPYVTIEMLNELEEVLQRRKFKERIESLSTSVEQLMALVKRLVAIIDTKEVVSYVKADSDDDIFLNCALNSEAKYVISGDRHLLDLKHVGEILIVSVSEFFEKERQKSIRK